MNFTHRTVHAITVEPRQSYSRTFDGYKAVARVVPAGTPGVIEYCGVVGGQPCVMFRGGGIEANLIGHNALEVERIEEAA